MSPLPAVMYIYRRKCNLRSAIVECVKVAGVNCGGKQEGVLISQAFQGPHLSCISLSYMVSCVELVSETSYSTCSDG